jgi:hypothetical protein
MVARRAKNAGGENEGGLGDVIENKCRQNVRLSVSRDVDENKRPIRRLWRC